MNSTISAIKCTHCGDDCQDELIQLEDNNFCCEGCKMVYEILNENDLCRFYDIDENAGVRIKTPKNTQAFDYLDNPKIIQQLIDFEDDTIVKVTFLLPQIHCSACIWLLENLYRLNDGVLKSKVNFLKKEVYITYLKEKTTLKSIVALLASIGYAPAIQLDNLNKKETVTDKKLYYQIGIAGFVFGNVMFFSFPEYFGLDNIEEQNFYRFFGYINLIFSLPVVFYSAQHYFQSAWAGLRQRHLNIDVPISIGVLTLFGRSVFEILTSTGAGYLDSLAGLVFFLLIGKWFQQRTYHQIAFDKDYQSYFPISANRKRNGETENVALTELEAKDIILVKNKELIPADAILLKGRAYIDYSFVTGESNPVSRKTGEQLYAGGRQEGEAIEVQLTKAVAQSYLTQLWNSEVFQKGGEKQYTDLINRISKYFTATILAIAFISGAYWLTIDTSIAVNVFTAVLIIACPCAIALS
ncbi:MAG: heavy metal translocating P-type ATPase, partial [Saprospiraceae bacterium]